MKRLLGTAFVLVFLSLCLGPVSAETPGEPDIAGYQIPPEGVWLPAGLKLPRVRNIPPPVCLVCDDEQQRETPNEPDEPAPASQPADEAGQ